MHFVYSKFTIQLGNVWGGITAQVLSEKQITPGKRANTVCGMVTEIVDLAMLFTSSFSKGVMLYDLMTFICIQFIFSFLSSNANIEIKVNISICYVSQKSY